MRVDGRVLKNATSVSPGRHAVVFFCKKFYSHIKHLHFPFLALAGAEWQDWRVFVRDELAYRGSDMVFQTFPNQEAEAYAEKWSRFVEEHACDWDSPDREPDFGKQVSCEPERLFMVDFTAEFRFREPGAALDPAALQGLVSSRPVVLDAPLTGDVEICLDFGREVSGLLQLDVEAGDGTVLDLHLVEFISRDGQVQHMWPYNHNGMRHVCSTGRNRHLSLKKRAGRYLFLSIRNASSPVVIHAISVVDATAGIQPVAAFECDDPLLNRIWEISERTLKMTMNDVLTDASPFEQALWVGDARNIALYTNQAYADPLPSRQSLRVIADSLEQFPIVGCCVPNRWEILIPAWSFLWGLHVWEYYFHSGDREFLESIWPAVDKNITGAESFLNKDGLFSGPLWNFFDWAPIAQNQETVLHNSMFMVAACHAAEKCANALGKQAAADALSQKRSQLVAAINRFWDPVKGSYPDAALADGSPSPKTSQHTSILALLYDIADDSMKADLLRNLTTPPKDMTTIRSPFAAQYLYETLEKLGSPREILDDIRRNYQPMIAMGATTVWETYPESTLSNSVFPTRSHCHGWSCSPIYFFNRLTLGIRPSAVGCREVLVSPWIHGLTRAKGGMATPFGTMEVRWELLPENKLLIEINAPEAITIRVERNESWGDRKVLFSSGRANESPTRPTTVEFN